MNSANPNGVSMKFRTDVTKGGYKILSLHGPDANGWYAGVLEKAGDIGSVTWNTQGRSDSDMRDLDLIPLDEPKPEATSEAFLFVANEISKRLDDFDQRLAAEMKRNDELYQDAVSRVNGLRADYLADQSAVQPSRVDALEERIEALERLS